MTLTTFTLKIQPFLILIKNHFQYLEYKFFVEIKSSDNYEKNFDSYFSKCNN